MQITQNYNINAAYLKLLFSICLIVVSFLFVLFGHEVWGGVIAMAILVVTAFILANFNILSPLMWFPPLLFLYSIANPVLVAIGDSPHVEMLDKVMLLQWVAMITFILVFGYSNKANNYTYKTKSLLNVNLIAYPLFLLSFILTLIFMAYVYSKGLSSKYDIKLDQSVFGSFSLFFSLLSITYALLLAHSILIKKKFPKKLVLFTLAYMFFALLVIGERDLPLRIILVTVFMYHVLYKPLKLKQLLLVSGVGLILIPIMSNFKNLLVDEENSRLLNQPETSFLNKILGTEFSAASKNLQTLISNDNWTFKHGETFIWDIQVVLGMGESSVMWFNKTFFPDLVARGGGNGFTLVGQGYVNFGLFGVILTFTILALILKLLYNKSQKSIFWLTVYITSIPIAIYMIRADLSTYLTQVSKQIILPLLIIYLVVHLVEGRKMRTRRISGKTL